MFRREFSLNDNPPRAKPGGRDILSVVNTEAVKQKDQLLNRINHEQLPKTAMVGEHWALLWPRVSC
jgi:hypothetical protein